MNDKDREKFNLEDEIRNSWNVIASNATNSMPKDADCMQRVLSEFNEEIPLLVTKALQQQREEIVKLVKDEINWEKKKVEEVTHDYKYVHEETALKLTNLYKRIEALKLVEGGGEI